MAGDDTKKMSAADQEELHNLELEEKRLRLQDLRFRVQNEQTRRDAILRTHEAQQKSLDQTNRDIVAKQSQCKHRKGGKGLNGILKGHDSNYSIIVHTYPWGTVQIICTRCSKEWNPPSAALRQSDPKEFRAQEREYNEALNWPTDNEPSGSVLFTFTQAPPPQKAVAR